MAKASSSAEVAGSTSGRPAPPQGPPQTVEGTEDWCSRVLSVFIHDISQPLTVLAGEIQLALLDSHSAAEYRQALEACQAQAQRLSTLVERVRELAHAELPATTTHRVDLVEVARDVIELLQPWAHAKGVVIALEAEASCQVLAASENLRQVVSHAIRMAVDRSPDSGMVRVMISASPQCGACQVVDESPVPPPEELAELLDPLGQDPARSHRLVDSRLEWCLARRMTQAWGGRFEVKGASHRCSVGFTVPV